MFNFWVFVQNTGFFGWKWSFWRRSILFITFSNSVKMMKKRKIWVHFYHFFELVKTYRKSKTTEYTFITFSGSWKLWKRETLEFSFKPFSDSLKMKILSSNWLFKLVKVNERSSFQYKFTPFSNWNGIFTKKVYIN